MINKSKGEIVDLLEKEEILLINKPKGITSFDCIRILQRIYKTKIPSLDKEGLGVVNKIKIGHTGTLDPNATGLMILGIRKGTKRLENLILENKAYEATILFGKKTDTDDIDGKVLETISEKEITKKLRIFLEQLPRQNLKDFATPSKEGEFSEIFKNILNTLIGENEYVIPNFSAVKINGKKMYELARSTTSPNLALFKEKLNRKMTVYKIENIKFEFPYLYCTFYVSKGTYIRSLSTKIGELLKIPTTLFDLKRIEIGEFKLENAIDLPEENVQEILKIKSKTKVVDPNGFEPLTSSVQMRRSTN
jgi:tRNA pseudouridine55 synthase